jgi:hypothetical protein
LGTQLAFFIWPMKKLFMETICQTSARPCGDGAWVTSDAREEKGSSDRRVKVKICFYQLPIK